MPSEMQQHFLALSQERELIFQRHNNHNRSERDSRNHKQLSLPTSSFLMLRAHLGLHSNLFPLLVLGTQLVEVNGRLLDQ